MATKLVYVDIATLDKGGVSAGAFLDERGVLTLGQFKCDENGIIRRVIRNGNLNPITTFYLQGSRNSEQLVGKEDTKKIMASKGGILERELSGGLDKDKKPLPARKVVAKFTFNESRGLDQYDPRAYDCDIISDTSAINFEGEFEYNA